MKRLIAVVFSILMAAGCGTAPLAQSSPSAPGSPTTPATATATPSIAPSPTPNPVVTAGAMAYVSVSVATGWRSRLSPRAVDAPALSNPVRIEAWLAGMTAADKVGLIDRVDTQVLLGDPVKVLAVQAGWAQVVVPDQPTPLDSRGYPVWIPLAQLTALSPRESDETATVVSPTTALRSYDGATTLRVTFGTVMPVVGEGAVSYVVSVMDHPMLVDKSAVTLQPLPQSASSILATARSFLGLQYLWGGTSGFGYDCSGFVYAMFKAHGIVLPRDGGPQSQVGRPVARANLLPGDLIFFASGGVVYHVAIYAGQGLVIDSPSPGYSVEQVPLSTFPPLGDYSGARRVLPAAST